MNIDNRLDNPIDPVKPIDIEKYSAMWKKMENGQITQQEWFEYCQSILGKHLEKNKDVLKRLKNR